MFYLVSIMSQFRILLAEDDKNLGMILKAFLDSKGYFTTLCSNGQDALDHFNAMDVDLCILDVMMPVMDGFTLAKHIKNSRKMMPILFLTAKKEQEDILEGFQIGAEDYITKPFSMDELLARVKVWQRWSSFIQIQAQPSVFHLGSLTLDAPRHMLTKGNESQKLTSKEADLLLLLCENMGNTLERSKALQLIWKEDSYLNARSMDVYITKLRKYFKDEPSVDIQNVHGIGFKLIVK